MLKLSSWLVLAGCFALPLVAGCESDKDLNNGDDDGENGATSNSTAGKGSGNKGSTDGGSDSTPDGGADNTGKGGEGGPGPSGSCDLSGDGKEVSDLPGRIEFDVTLTADTVWRISGLTVVTEGATVSIEPCTRIVGDGSQVSALIFSRGSKIDAVGTEDEPILFTSEAEVGDRRPGDWGGVALLGWAPINAGGGTAIVEGVPNLPEYTYGGDDAEDSSGSMEYVRIEFAGYQISADSELNGLTLGGVGSGTKLSHIMVNSSLDDCFEWFGGTVNADHLICNGDGDDMFDTDLGYTGELSYLFGRKRENPSADPNAFEWDNNRANPTLKPSTNPIVQYATTCGFGFEVPGVSLGIVLRRGTWGSLDNWVEVGFDYGMDQRDYAPGDELTITNSTMSGNVKGDIVDPTDCNSVKDPDPINASGCDGASPTWDNGFDEEAWFMGTDAAFPDNTGNTTDSPGFTVDDCQADGGPNENVTESGKGAFTDGNWMTGAWVDWTDK